MVNKCGIICSECPSYQRECAGCREVSGKPFWTEHIGGSPCPIYQCCGEKDLETCGACRDLPCKTWFDLKDPSYSDQEHLDSINKRVKNLTEDK